VLVLRGEFVCVGPPAAAAVKQTINAQDAVPERSVLV
jgi:hypothetical protein